MSKSTKQLVKEIREGLEARGVHVAVKHAVTTSSVYLAFDYGVLKQARVGDHKGRGYNYTYEIGSHVKPPFEVAMSYEGHAYTRYRYTDEKVEDLITQVLIARWNMRSKYGKERYEAYKAAACAKETPQKPKKDTSRHASRWTDSAPSKYDYRTPMEYRRAVEASPEYAAQQARDAAEAQHASDQMMAAMGPDFDPNGFSTY